MFRWLEFRSRRKARLLLLHKRLSALDLAIARLSHSDLLTPGQVANELGTLMYWREELRAQLEAE